MKKKLAIIGAGGHSKVVADCAEHMQKWQNISFFDDSFSSEKSIGALYKTTKDSFDIFIAIGNNKIRREIQKKFMKAGFHIVTILHPSAIIANSATIATGSIVAAGAIISPDVKIGQGCIINTGATIDHDCELKDFVHISPGANLAGSINIGTRTWIGIGSSICENLNIGSDVIVGAGAAVISNVSDARTVKGVPAR